MRRRQYDAWRTEVERLDASAPRTARGIRLTSLGANDGSPKDVKDRRAAPLVPRARANSPAAH